MSQQIVDSLNKQVEQNFHGQGREAILKALEQSPTADTIAQITYDTVIEIDGQAGQQGAPLEVDVLMAVATEAIDMLVEIVEAMGASDMSTDELREESLVKVIMLHMQAVEGDPEEKAAAEEMLAAMTGDGTTDEAMGYVNKRAADKPETMQAAGAAMVAPRQKPMAAGIREGLMR